MTKREREITDPNQIDEILRSCMHLHLGLVDEGKPYVVPLNYGITKDEEDGHYLSTSTAEIPDVSWKSLERIKTVVLPWKEMCSRLKGA
ncbi:pyridoxamine 5'-phosphate oxidase family protein [Pseudobutyrivibrio xylanivorans]|uniref:pyridoxamine 5'-phosphate oxidase family protein n=1 Tax=Pseudobutyrivibrio xylanivorans TaxID=185007 RepID=UPI001FAAE90F|nr:pyridoxamine 5'-phosphate oxidase family protein [Pseudobutyrivibrio xylanivorans]